MAAFHGKLKVLKQLVQQNPEVCLDDKDSNQMTALDYAISQKKLDVVEFLSKCGAKEYNTQQAPTPSRSADIDQAIKSGVNILRTVNEQNKNTIRDTLKHFPTDLCDFLNEWTSVVDKLEGANAF